MALVNYIPDEKITEVRNRTDIVEIVSESVRLKRTGKNLLGLCPFHTEKTPSFTVSPDKQIFYCFGCGEGGNAFSFLMKLMGLSFPEAVRRLAERYGIDIPRGQLTDEQRRKQDHRQRMIAAHAKATAFFQRCLKKTSAGKRAFDYLLNRGMLPETIEQFSIGLAPDGWHGLSDHLKAEGFAFGEAQAAGLILPKKRENGYYDRFRNRIIFPIYDFGERVVGFGGRVMDDSEPKYLNSPESSIYNKRRLLYGLNRSRQACRRTGTIHIVEGYFDVLSLYQNGIENVAATLGTALTDDHIRLIKGCAEQTVLIFDADDAGIKAALRSSKLFLAAGVSARVLVLPDNEDPDSYVQKKGPAAFNKLVETAPGIVSFITDSAVQRYGLSVEGRVRVITELQPVLSAISDPVAQSLYIHELGDRIGVDEKAIKEKLRKDTASKRSFIKPTKNGLDAQPEMEITSRTYKMEKLIVAMLLQYPKMMTIVRESGIIERFSDQGLQDIGRWIIEHINDEKGNISNLIGDIDNENLKRTIASLAMGDHGQWTEKICLQTIDNYKNKITNTSRQTIKNKIKAAEIAGDYETVEKLYRKLTSITKSQSRETVELE